jgi:hypothetical protein
MPLAKGLGLGLKWVAAEESDDRRKVLHHRHALPGFPVVDRDFVDLELRRDLALEEI